MSSDESTADPADKRAARPRQAGRNDTSTRARPTQNRQVQLSPGALEEPGGARAQGRARQGRAGQGGMAVVADVHEDGEVRLASGSSGCSINGALGQSTAEEWSLGKGKICGLVGCRWA